MNAAPARHMGQDLLELVDVVIVNRVEAEAMFGSVIDDRASARTALEGRANRAHSVVITLGGEGLVVAETSGDITDVFPVPVMVTSTHGAGDCFVGVLAAELAQGAPLGAACQVANQRAATFVSRVT